jgi:hypothetical protein
VEEELKLTIFGRYSRTARAGGQSGAGCPDIDRRGENFEGRNAQNNDEQKREWKMKAETNVACKKELTRRGCAASAEIPTGEKTFQGGESENEETNNGRTQ